MRNSIFLAFIVTLVVTAVSFADLTGVFQPVGAWPILNGGTGAQNAPAALSNLGAAGVGVSNTFAASQTMAGLNLTGNVQMADGALVELATGTLTNLALRFRGAATTGFYRHSASGIRYVTSGSTAFSYDGSQFSVGAGAGMPVMYGITTTNTQPAFCWSANTNTGLGRNAIGEPSMIASGTEAMRWTDLESIHPAKVASTAYLHEALAATTTINIATPVRLTIDAKIDAAGNRWLIASGSVLCGNVQVVGVANDATRSRVAYNINFTADRLNNTVTIATTSKDIVETANLTGCDADVAADGVTNSFYISAVGSTTATIKWGATVHYTEVNVP